MCLMQIISRITTFSSVLPTVFNLLFHHFQGISSDEEGDPPS